ncbi:hypothetical protein SAMN05444395_11158 [Flavobacterium fryxellicola]|uniref:Uncharacterized protein n=1 Tax=Flavobacterium fryxellicola TaxID=249352 RepID=A0A167ZLH8_9FLAO|nr:hypothetical protein [Flavobacterium fryxellicola]OAB30578.1 hypothetical protein FBFR_01915 [Flavobacterium fryxellicola]SHN77130.1 hypothetical protein SAMN05444395_11158 [Flavobacterium fryxellicola]
MKYKRNNLGVAPCNMKILNERLVIIEEFLHLNAIVENSPLVNSGGCKTIKCGSRLQKGELVYLFHILIEGGTLFFDPIDKKKNRRLFQSFIEKNFTYLGEGNLQHHIMDCSRHFSECLGFTYREKQVRYLEKIIMILLKKKESLNQL